MQTSCSLLHYSATRFLSLTFASSSFSYSYNYAYIVIKNDQQSSALSEETIVVAGRRRLSSICSMCLLWTCVLDTQKSVLFQMSSLLHFYRTRSATTINQLRPIQRIRSHSPDDVLLRQTVIDLSRNVICFFYVLFSLFSLQFNLFVRITEKKLTLRFLIYWKKM